MGRLAYEPGHFFLGPGAQVTRPGPNEEVVPGCGPFDLFRNDERRRLVDSLDLFHGVAAQVPRSMTSVQTAPAGSGSSPSEPVLHLNAGVLHHVAGCERAVRRQLQVRGDHRDGEASLQEGMAQTAAAGFEHTCFNGNPAAVYVGGRRCVGRCGIAQRAEIAGEHRGDLCCAQIGVVLLGAADPIVPRLAGTDRSTQPHDDRDGAAVALDRLGSPARR